MQGQGCVPEKSGGKCEGSAGVSRPPSRVRKGRQCALGECAMAFVSHVYIGVDLVSWMMLVFQDCGHVTFRRSAPPRPAAGAGCRVQMQGSVRDFYFPPRIWKTLLVRDGCLSEGWVAQNCMSTTGKEVKRPPLPFL